MSFCPALILRPDVCTGVGFGVFLKTNLRPVPLAWLCGNKRNFETLRTHVDTVAVTQHTEARSQKTARERNPTPLSDTS